MVLLEEWAALFNHIDITDSIYVHDLQRNLSIFLISIYIVINCS